MQEYTLAEVAAHNTKDDLWIVVDDKVYDLSKFSNFHPGGLPPLKWVAGKDATEEFYGLHRANILKKPKYQRLQIGVVAGKGRKANSDDDVTPVTPYGESLGFWRRKSPYYKPTHHRFRSALKKILSKIVTPYVNDWDAEGKLPSKKILRDLGRTGILPCFVAHEENAPRLFRKWGVELPGGIRPEDFDSFHALILAEEIRVATDGCYGVTDGMIAGIGIGLPPILKFGSDEMIERVVPDVIRGEKCICLAITEPYAGSDVAKIRTTGTAAPGGWRVDGVKKWITNGVYADYFTTLVRTKKHGMCMLLVERDEDEMEVQTRLIKTSYSTCAGTAYVTFTNAFVPERNVVGKLGRGFYQVMQNFNFERFGMICGGNRHARMVVEQCFLWASQRKVFGKSLISQPLIRFKLAQMVAEVESVHSWLEDLCYQMTQMSESEIHQYLSGTIALLKYKQTRAATVVSDNACQIFGGRALTRTGMGSIVEKFQKSFKFMAILGGSEEIMADFAIRQASKRARSDGLARL